MFQIKRYFQRDDLQLMLGLPGRPFISAVGGGRRFPAPLNETNNIISKCFGANDADQNCY